VALDDATKRAYRRADSATLLALLPELRRLIKRTHKELEQVLPAGEAGTDDDPPMLPDVAGTGDGNGDGDGEFTVQLLGYSKAVIDRERWVREELKRRGLIPLWPGEQSYLEEDA